jgi:tetratricopeptide (TPR) repeat protein
VWSGSFDREVNDLFAVQAELAGAVVDAIVPTARGDVVDVKAAPPTTSLDAYDLYLLARSQLALRTPSSCLKAISLMEQAVSLDPKFARAHALLAQSLLFSRMFEVDPKRSQEYLDRAEASIYRALALDPKLSEAYDAHGNLLRDTNRPGAEDAYKRAIEINPNNAWAWHDYAVYLGNSANRKAESRRATERSLTLDPRQPITWANYLMAVLPEGRKRFEQEYERAVRMVGDMPGGLARLPHPSWSTDREGFRRELAADIAKANGDAYMLDSLTMPRAAIIGFPVEVLKSGLAKRFPQGDDELPVVLNYYRAWQPVDVEKAARLVTLDPGAHHGVNFGVVCLMLQTEAAGLAQDWPRLDRILRELRTRVGDHNQQVNAVDAFWLSVRGRDQDAANVLARAEPLLEEEAPPVLGGDTHWGQMETAQVRIYRNTGRRADADRLVSSLLPRLQAEWRRAEKTCDWDGFMSEPLRYAALAASEGRREAAVEALQTAMRCGDLPFGFFPQLPWFRSLEGYAPYDALVEERAARVERIRAELTQLEAIAGRRSPGLMQSPGQTTSTTAVR